MPLLTNVQMSAQIIIFLCLVNTIVFARNVRIVGGEDAHISEFPYSVSFRWLSNNMHFCGGVIMSQRFIVTVAHCIFDLHKRIHDVTIHIGSTNTTSTNGPVLTIHRIYIDPKYTSRMSSNEMNRYDFAIIKVKETIIFNELYNKVELPTEDIKENDSAMVSGWGLTSYPKYVFSQQLQKAPMKILDNAKCSMKVGFIVHYEQICAFQAEGVGACVGDSGSPLIRNGKLIGISSFIHPCGQGFPDLYIRIYPYKNFINAVIHT